MAEDEEKWKQWEKMGGLVDGTVNLLKRPVKHEPAAAPAPAPATGAPELDHATKKALKQMGSLGTRIAMLERELQHAIKARDDCRREGELIAKEHEELKGEAKAEVVLAHNLEKQLEIVHSNVEEVQEARTLQHPTGELRTSIADLANHVQQMHMNRSSDLAKRTVMTTFGEPARGQLKGLLHRLNKVGNLVGGGCPELDKKQTVARKLNFQLVNQNGRLEAEANRLVRQTKWAIASAGVVQEEIHRIHLGQPELGHAGVKHVAEERFKALEKGSGELEQSDVFEPCTFASTDRLKMRLMDDLIATRGRGVLAYVRNPLSPLSADSVLSTVSQEWFSIWRRAHKMESVLLSLRDLMHVTSVERAIYRFVAVIQGALNCDRGSVWIVDHARKIMWTRIPKSPVLGNQELGIHDSIVLRVPLPEPGEDGTGKGLIRAGYSARTPIVADLEARPDPRFNNAADLKSGYVTRTVCVIPVLQHRDKEQPRVATLLQAVNKNGGQFDHDDVYVLSALGQIFLEVFTACEKTGSAGMMAERKDNLLREAEKVITICRKPVDVVGLLNECLRELFTNVVEVAVHLIGLGSTKKLVVHSPEEGEPTVQLVTTEGFQGIVGHVSKHRITASVLNPHVRDCASWGSLLVEDPHRAEKEAYDPSVDIPTANIGVGTSLNTFLHTFPMNDGNRCLAVCQMAVVQKDVDRFGDDGSYTGSREHSNIVQQLLAYFQPFLVRFFPEVVNRGVGLESRTVSNNEPEHEGSSFSDSE
uniref:GAF domain-containing protein n=1 Tax=Oxyrrhis marina TaxID=2969 RepID=A0A7S4GQ30_OXYMA